MDQTLLKTTNLSPELQEAKAFLEQLKANPESVENAIIKKKYSELLNQTFKNAESNNEWARVVLALLQLNILDKSEVKEKYTSLLEIAFEKAQSDSNWAEYIVPALLQLKILDQEALKKLPSNSYPIRSLSQLRFLEQCHQAVSADDVLFMKQIDSILNQEEQKLLFQKDYQFFSEFKAWIANKKYQKLRELKSACYPDEEQSKLRQLTDYFWNEVWTYFFDKAHTERTLNNRFRDPHNALLHTDEIVWLAEELGEKWVSKADFIINYLGVAGDRNNGYQQLNEFLINYKPSRKDEIEAELSDPNGLKDQAFLEYANKILEHEKSGILYQNIDQFEQITTVLSMLNKKENLKKLQKLAIINNPQDKIRYNYFKDTIYHPRTKPLIIDLYEKPEKFLGLDDTTFSNINHLHQAKKPSHMVTDFEYLDFEAKDLVDCLPLGVYDQLSYFKPFEKQYLINASRCYPGDEVQAEIMSFLDAADQEKISTIISTFNKSSPDAPLSFKQWKEDKKSFIDDFLTKNKLENLISLFISLGYQEFNKYQNTKLMTAKISPKSDPNNRFNGFNCDALAEWHGKKVVAMFNPYCTDFCIYEWSPSAQQDNLKVTS